MRIFFLNLQKIHESENTNIQFIKIEIKKLNLSHTQIRTGIKNFNFINLK